MQSPRLGGFLGQPSVCNRVLLPGHHRKSNFGVMWSLHHAGFDQDIPLMAFKAGFSMTY